MSFGSDMYKRFCCCYRLGEFTKFVETVEDLAKKLQREDLSTDEYKDLQAQFQVTL